MLRKLTKFTLLLAAASGLHAANILTTTGSSPFGFTGQPGFVLAWNQAISYTGVTITMPLVDNTPTPLSGVQGTVYLTTQIGPGTTAANQVAAIEHASLVEIVGELLRLLHARIKEPFVGVALDLA